MTMHQTAPFRGVAKVRADASDPAALVTQIKTAFEEFKAANDQRIKALETGKSDVVLDQKVDTINATITDLQSQLADVAAKAAARGLGGNGGEDPVAKAAAVFAAERGIDPDVEAYKSYVSALDTYFRRGDATPAAVRAEMSVGSDPDGGYSVTPDMTGRIVQRVYETSPMRQVATVVTIGTDALEGFNDLDEAAASWVGEKQERGDTGTPQLGKWSIPVHEQAAMPKVTQKLLDDSLFNIETWLSGKVADKFARSENTAFVVGDGVLKPRGLFSYSTLATGDATRAWGNFQHIASGTSGTLGSTPGDKLIDLVFALKAFYRNNANWMMSRAILADIRKIKDGDGSYLWQPDYTQRQGGLLLGYGIVEAEDTPAAAANALPIAFGDFREAYTIVDRTGIRVLRDPFTQKGFIRFYTTKRVGGGAVNFEAVKFLKLATS
ncbi:phage major capsid protein [Acidiphilium sp.]|uniref:phage major capsid protein n=1 Tax=Acidiphilium sp. TaxID=527 RepID=UPI00258DCD13|nr:phage major capsid protein [Acidiphilium sp.]